MTMVSKLIAVLLMLAVITAQASTGKMVGCDTALSGDHQPVVAHTMSQDDAMHTPCMDSAKATSCLIDACACFHASFYQAAILGSTTSINQLNPTKADLRFTVALDDTLLSYLFRPPILSSIR